MVMNGLYIERAETYHFWQLAQGGERLEQQNCARPCVQLIEDACNNYISNKLFSKYC